ncbi:MAG: hypothetical protein WC521_01395 [Bdellovibrionales bacterium]|jgi:hypothetical protein
MPDLEKNALLLETSASEKPEVPIVDAPSRRGRPPGSKDSKPRKRRTKTQKVHKVPTVVAPKKKAQQNKYGSGPGRPRDIKIDIRSFFNDVLNETSRPLKSDKPETPVVDNVSTARKKKAQQNKYGSGPGRPRNIKIDIRSFFTKVLGETFTPLKSPNQTKAASKKTGIGRRPTREAGEENTYTIRPRKNVWPEKNRVTPKKIELPALPLAEVISRVTPEDAIAEEFLSSLEGKMPSYLTDYIRTNLFDAWSEKNGFRAEDYGHLKQQRDALNKRGFNIIIPASEYQYNVVVRDRYEALLRGNANRPKRPPSNKPQKDPSSVYDRAFTRRNEL